MGRILIVDDEKSVLSSIERLLDRHGHEVLTAGRAEDALRRIEEVPPDAIVMDIRLPGMSGLDAFRRIRAEHPRLPVIIMTGYGTMDSAVEATKLGAFEYLIKPFDPDTLLRHLDQALECVRLMHGEVSLEAGPDLPVGEAMIGATPRMQDVYKTIGRVAQTDATVLIRGETGTGKELVARAIYQHSRRSAAPMLLVNCAAIPEPLMESELFGHERGAFTGAAARRIGKLEQANGGTVFLDEIGDMPVGIQAKLLRVLQERRFERVGGNETITVDLRIIAATNRNLEGAIAEDRFRSDLYHRLNVVTIHLPPLRDRREDIPLLAGYFLARFSRPIYTDVPVLTREALDLLVSRDWPGNVRELEHCVHRAVIFSRGYPIQAEQIARALESSAGEEANAREAVEAEQEQAVRNLVREYLAGPPSDDRHRRFLDIVDRALVVEALNLTGGNQTHAARLLGLSRPTLQSKMQRFAIRKETLIRES